jgi:hypothetical protein
MICSQKGNDMNSHRSGEQSLAHEQEEHFEGPEGRDPVDRLDEEEPLVESDAPDSPEISRLALINEWRRAVGDWWEKGEGLNEAVTGLIHLGVRPCEICISTALQIGKALDAITDEDGNRFRVKATVLAEWLELLGPKPNRALDLFASTALACGLRPDDICFESVKFVHNFYDDAGSKSPSISQRLRRILPFARW